MRHLTALALGVLLLTGCTTTLRHPDTGATITCHPGFAWGGGTGPAGLALASAALVMNGVNYGLHRHCIAQAEAAGFEEVK